MIPKIIHYCWFGHNPLPPLALKCIASWKKYLPDYEIKEWNEENFDVNIIPYTREAYAAGKYAFVTDYARFWILYKYGGIYFDTDVEMIRPIDDIIAAGGFMGYETDPQPSSVDVCLSGGNETEVSSDLGLAPQPLHPLQPPPCLWECHVIQPTPPNTMTATMIVGRLKFAARNSIIQNTPFHISCSLIRSWSRRF